MSFRNIITLFLALLLVATQVPAAQLVDACGTAAAPCCCGDDDGDGPCCGMGDDAVECCPIDLAAPERAPAPAPRISSADFAPLAILYTILSTGTPPAAVQHRIPGLPDVVSRDHQQTYLRVSSLLI